MKKFSGNLEVSVFPVHKASLLGLTSTNNPTIGIGFSENYCRWSFHTITFHKTSNKGLVLSQFEQNVSFRAINKKNISCTVFNTSVSVAKNSALYMIPTISVGIGNLKSLKFDLTPFSWGFNTNV